MFLMRKTHNTVTLWLTNF